MEGTDATGEQIREAVRKRTDVLAELADDSWRKPALVESLDVSRSTADRAIDELLDAGLVERDDGVYRATNTGELALDVHREYASLTDSIATAMPIIEAKSPEAPFDTTLLADGAVQLAEPRAPENALQETAESLRKADVVRGFAPVIKSSYASLLYEEVSERDLEVEVIVEREARGSLATVADNREELANLLVADEVTVLEADTDLPYALWLMSGPDIDQSGITVHDSGGIVGVITNDSPDAVEWCRRRYESVRRDADPLPLDSLN